MGNYGYLHIARVIDYDAVSKGFYLESLALARTSRWGPVPSAVPGVEVGDKVVLGATGTTRDNLIILGVVNAAYPGIGDIPGLQAALDAKADDTEITAINATLTSHAALLTSHGTQLADHASRLTTLESEMNTAQADIDALEAAVAALQAAQITTWGPGLIQTGTNVKLDDYYAKSLATENEYARQRDGQVASSPLCTLGSGLTFNIPLNLAGYVRGQYYVRTSATTRVAAANGDANPRLDRLVLRLTRATGFITPALIQGTPAASPVLPALTQDATTWDVPLCYATCPGSGSAQNYANLVQEFDAVSPARAEHVWTGTRAYGPGVNDQSVSNLVAVRDAGVATVASSTNVFLNRAGRWGLTLLANSDAPVSGVASVWIDWPSGLWSSAGGRLYDTVPRSQGFAGAGQLNRVAAWTGYIAPRYASLPMTLKGSWTPSTGTATVTYGFELHAVYLGG